MEDGWYYCEQQSSSIVCGMYIINDIITIAPPIVRKYIGKNVNDLTKYWRFIKLSE